MTVQHIKVALLYETSFSVFRKLIQEGNVVLICEYDGSSPCFIAGNGEVLDSICDLLGYEKGNYPTDNEWYYLDIPDHMDELEDLLGNQPTIQVFEPEI